jgi:hypothetical protein
MRLAVVDDGTSAGDPESTNGRGLADMRAAARTSGASIQISFDGGTRVEAAWPAL